MIISVLCNKTFFDFIFIIHITTILVDCLACTAQYGTTGHPLAVRLREQKLASEWVVGGWYWL